MDIEINVFIEILEDKKEKEINGFKFWTGKIGDKDVVISKTEVGMVNASISTMIALEKFKSTIIIN